MALRHEDIKDDRQWRAATGLSGAQFADLTEHFGLAYERIYGKTISERQASSRQQARFTTYAEQLFFLLFSLKAGLTLDVLALGFGLSRTQVSEVQALTMATLRAALVHGGYHPRREYGSVDEFVRDWHGEASRVVLVDATELRRQRPGGQEAQAAVYSGKKKAHTQKVTVMARPDRWIKYVSEIRAGREHDFALLREGFPPEAGRWFGGKEVHVDLGYQGIERAYAGAAVSIPAKKPRGGELSVLDKASNKSKSKVRVRVEHAIGGMKRYRVLSDRLRRHNMKTVGTIVGIAAGLWNFSLNPSNC